MCVSGGSCVLPYSSDVLVDVTFKILGWGERAACWFCDWSKMKTSQLLAVGGWFPPGTPPVSSTSETDISSPLPPDMTLAVAETLTPNKLN